MDTGLNIDAEKTRFYYSSLTADDLCDCDYCRNFRMQIASAHPNLAAHMDALGINISKPFEVLLPLEEDVSEIISRDAGQSCNNGNGSDDHSHAGVHRNAGVHSHADSGDLLEYPLSMYVAFGSCDESFTDSIGNVDIWITTSHPDTGIDGEDHFVIGFGPVLLKKLLPCG